MKKLRPTTQYKKDYKRFRNNPKKVEALKEVLLIIGAFGFALRIIPLITIIK